MSLIVKVGKKGKQFLKKYILPPAKHSISYTRRLERVKTDRRICAMTFDDGPMNMPVSPDRFEGRCLTDVLLDHPMIGGLCYTQLTDVEQEVNGIYTYDRQEKFPAKVLKEILSRKAACEE